MSITNIQMRMARAGLKMTVRELASLVGCTKDTITRIEKSGIGRPSTMAKIQAALEEAGIDFIPENGGGVGVRLRQPATAKNQPETE